MNIICLCSNSKLFHRVEELHFVYLLICKTWNIPTPIYKCLRHKKTQGGDNLKFRSHLPAANFQILIICWLWRFAFLRSINEDERVTRAQRTDLFLQIHTGAPHFLSVYPFVFFHTVFVFLLLVFLLLVFTFFLFFLQSPISIHPSLLSFSFCPAATIAMRYFALRSWLAGLNGAVCN